MFNLKRALLTVFALSSFATLVACGAPTEVEPASPPILQSSGCEEFKNGWDAGAYLISLSGTTYFMVADYDGLVVSRHDGPATLSNCEAHFFSELPTAWNRGIYLITANERQYVMVVDSDGVALTPHPGKFPGTANSATPLQKGTIPRGWHILPVGDVKYAVWIDGYGVGISPIAPATSGTATPATAPAK
jgi:hypothetical protein